MTFQDTHEHESAIFRANEHGVVLLPFEPEFLKIPARSGDFYTAIDTITSMTNNP